MVIFTDEFLDKVKKDNDIIDVASEYFDLQKCGDLYKAHCKHKGGDKSPSLTFFPDTQSFYCFSCNAGKRSGETNGSDLISFVQWMENIEWQDAVRLLANRAGIPIEQEKLNEGDLIKLKSYEVLLNQNRRYWSALMDDESNKAIREWFYTRGIDDQDIARWRLGAAKVNGKAVPTYAIIDEFNRTVGFSKRVDGKSKYINDKNSEIFKKGNILYGLNFIKKEIRKLDYILIVEGYNDAIMCQKYGAPAVALMGTALTAQQIELVKKYTDNVVLFLDGDEPGILNTLNYIKDLTSQGFCVEVLNFYGYDPDDIVSKYKRNFLSVIQEKKKPGIQFIADDVISNYVKETIRLKRDTIKAIDSVLEFIEDPVEKDLQKNVFYEMILSNKEEIESDLQ